jgi:hypothetical protein
MIDAMVSSSDGVAVAASARKFPEGGPTRYQAAFETAARSQMALTEQVLWLNQAQIRTATNAFN